MPHWELSWQLAAIVAVCLFSAAGLARLSRSRAPTVAMPFLRESGFVVALYALWQYAGSFSVMGTEGALGRAEWIWRAERAWHLTSETSIQRLVRPPPMAAETSNTRSASMPLFILKPSLRPRSA